MSNLKQIINVHEQLTNKNSIKDRFEEILGKNAKAYVTSVLNIIKSNDKIQACDPMSIWNVALKSATFSLPLDPNMGQAYIIPYKEKGKDVAQFQLGYKGILTLAKRTQMYKFINATEVVEGELVHRNRLTGSIDFEWIQNDKERLEKPIIGYVCYIELKDGFSHTLYMSVPEMEAHARRYSKAYQYDIKSGYKNSLWSDEYAKGFMAYKTVLKLNITRNGVMSIDAPQFADAIRSDMKQIGDDGDPIIAEVEKEDVISDTEDLTNGLNNILQGETLPINIEGQNNG